MQVQEGVAAITNLNFSDPDQYQASIRGGNAMLSLLGKGKFTAELSTIRVGRLTLQRGRESLPRLASTCIPQNVVGILGWIGAGPLPVVRGLQMRPGEWLSLQSGMESHHRTTGPVDYVSLTIDAGDLASAAIDQTGARLASSAGKVLRVPEDIGAWLVAVIEAATRVSVTTPGIFGSPLSAAALENALLEPMVACLTHSASSEEPLSHGRRAAIARRFEASIEANVDSPLPIAAFCRSIGVSERGLRKLCVEHFGISPLRFLTLRRLHLARRALLRSDHTEASVTRIAMDYGFWQLGRFAATYKSLFGESPSATLRRRGTG